MSVEMDISIGWLETILKRHSIEKSIAKVNSVSYKPAMENKGEQYASQMVRAELDVVLGSGFSKKLSVIIKTLPESELIKSTLLEFDLFRTECTMYRDIMPMMERLMINSGDRSEPPWCQCYGVRPFDQIVLEDLKEYGFTLGKRKEQLDLKYTTLTLQSLGRLHACMAVLESKGHISRMTFLPTFYGRQDLPTVQNFINGAIRKFHESIVKCWGKEWSHVAEKVKHSETNALSRLAELAKIDNSRFNVINHGDCWVNNMMFKLDPVTSEPVAFRFLDFQISHFNSFAWDVTYFLFSSVKRTMLYNKYDEILKIYFDSLVRHLEQYGYDMSRAPSFQHIKDEMKRLQFFSFIVIASILPILMANPEDAADMEELNKGNSGHNDNMFENPNFIRVVKEDFKYLLQDNVM